MQEYRTRLIAAIVTDKLDVRETAATLSVETYAQNPIENRGPAADGMNASPYGADALQEELAIEREVTA